MSPLYVITTEGPECRSPRLATTTTLYGSAIPAFTTQKQCETFRDLQLPGCVILHVDTRERASTLANMVDAQQVSGIFLNPAPAKKGIFVLNPSANIVSELVSSFR